MIATFPKQFRFQIQLQDERLVYTTEACTNYSLRIIPSRIDSKC